MSAGRDSIPVYLPVAVGTGFGGSGCCDLGKRCCGNPSRISDDGVLGRRGELMKRDEEQLDIEGGELLWGSNQLMNNGGASYIGKNRRGEEQVGGCGNHGRGNQLVPRGDCRCCSFKSGSVRLLQFNSDSTSVGRQLECVLASIPFRV